MYICTHFSYTCPIIRAKAWWNKSPLAFSLMSTRCLCCRPPQPQYLQAWDRFSTRSKLHSLFHSLPSRAPVPLPPPWSQQFRLISLTMTFLHMLSSHDGDVRSCWLSADFRTFSLTSWLCHRSSVFGVNVLEMPSYGFKQSRLEQVCFVLPRSRLFSILEAAQNLELCTQS